MAFENIKFRYEDEKLVALLVQKYQVNTEGIHRIVDDTDTKQIKNRITNRLRQCDETKGARIKTFMDPKTNRVQTVMSAWTNIDFDIFGFCKIVMPKQEGLEEEVITIPFYLKTITTSKLW